MKPLVPKEALVGWLVHRSYPLQIVNVSPRQLLRRDGKKGG